MAGVFACAATAQTTAPSPGGGTLPSVPPAAGSSAAPASPGGPASAENAAQGAPKVRPLSGDGSAYLRARFAVGVGDFARAVQDFRQAVPSGTDDPTVTLQEFLAAVMSQDSEAVALAHQLPDNPVARLVIANADAAAGNWDAAERDFVALPRQPLTQLLQPILVAWAQQGAGRTDEALATLGAAMRDPRANGIYALHAGMIADVAGRNDDADRFYATAQEAGGALNLREVQIIASWQARQGRRGVAQATIQTLGAGGQAVALAVPGLEGAIANRPVTSATDGIAEAYLALASSLSQQDGADYALLLLHMALGLRPDFPAARLMMADTQAQLGQSSDALATLAAVSAASPLAPLVAMRRASLLQATGQNDQAAQVLQALIRQFPQRPEPEAALGDLMRGQHRWAEAVAAYTSALAHIPHQGPQDWALYFSRGTAYDRAHDWPKAEADLEHALSLQPNQPVILNYLGYAWTEQGRNLDRARQMLEKAVAFRPNDGNIVDSLGWALLRQGDSAGAVRELERAVEMESEDSTINGHLGDAYWAIGRRLEAQYQWRLALDLKPDPEDVPKLQAKLRDAAAGAKAPHGALPASLVAPRRTP